MIPGLVDSRKIGKLKNTLQSVGITNIPEKTVANLEQRITSEKQRFRNKLNAIQSDPSLYLPTNDISQLKKQYNTHITNLLEMAEKYGIPYDTKKSPYEQAIEIHQEFNVRRQKLAALGFVDMKESISSLYRPYLDMFKPLKKYIAIGNLSIEIETKLFQLTALGDKTYDQLLHEAIHPCMKEWIQKEINDFLLQVKSAEVDMYSPSVDKNQKEESIERIKVRKNTLLSSLATIFAVGYSDINKLWFQNGYIKNDKVDRAPICAYELRVRGHPLERIAGGGRKKTRKHKQRKAKQTRHRK
jgi:hypothetical protein